MKLQTTRNSSSPQWNQIILEMTYGLWSMWFKSNTFQEELLLCGSFRLSQMSRNHHSPNWVLNEVSAQRCPMPTELLNDTVRGGVDIWPIFSLPGLVGRHFPLWGLPKAQVAFATVSDLNKRTLMMSSQRTLVVTEDHACLLQCVSCSAHSLTST